MAAGKRMRPTGRTSAWLRAALAALALAVISGAWPALESGLVQRNVATVRAVRQQALARSKEILTGTNAYPDITESLPAVLAVAPRAASGEAAKVNALSLPRLRLAEPFEALRDKSDRILAATGARPKVFLATLGAPADFTASRRGDRAFRLAIPRECSRRSPTSTAICTPPSPPCAPAGEPT